MKAAASRKEPDQPHGAVASLLFEWSRHLEQHGCMPPNWPADRLDQGVSSLYGHHRQPEPSPFGSADGNLTVVSLRNDEQRMASRHPDRAPALGPKGTFPGVGVGRNHPNPAMKKVQRPGRSQTETTGRLTKPRNPSSMRHKPKSRRDRSADEHFSSQTCPLLVAFGVSGLLIGLIRVQLLLRSWCSKSASTSSAAVSAFLFGRPGRPGVGRGDAS